MMRTAIINARSAKRKTKDLANQFNVRGVNVVLLTETWEDEKTNSDPPQTDERDYVNLKSP